MPTPIPEPKNPNTQRLRAALRELGQIHGKQFWDVDMTNPNTSERYRLAVMTTATGPNGARSMQVIAEVPGGGTRKLAMQIESLVMASKLMRGSMGQPMGSESAYGAAPRARIQGNGVVSPPAEAQAPPLA